MPNGKRELSFAPSKRPCKLSFWVSERVKHSLLSEARRISRSPPPPARLSLGTSITLLLFLQTTRVHHEAMICAKSSINGYAVNH